MFCPVTADDVLSSYTDQPLNLTTRPKPVINFRVYKWTKEDYECHKKMYVKIKNSVVEPDSEETFTDDELLATTCKNYSTTMFQYIRGLQLYKEKIADPVNFKNKTSYNFASDYITKIINFYLLCQRYPKLKYACIGARFISRHLGALEYFIINDTDKDFWKM